jgi:hypothetical protein
MSSESEEAYILLNLNVEGVLGYRLFFWGLPSPTPPHPQSLFLVGEERRTLLLGILGVGERMGWGRGERIMECLSWEMHLAFGRNKFT